MKATVPHWFEEGVRPDTGAESGEEGGESRVGQVGDAG